jgi:hypothetical protein
MIVTTETASPAQDTSGTQAPAPDVPEAETIVPEGPPSPQAPAGPQPQGPAARRPSALIFRQLPADSRTFSAGWWLLLAIAAVGVAAWLTVLVARGTQFTTGHRAAAAWTALLVVVALAIVVQVILLSYQSRLPDVAGAAPGQLTLAYRRRGLKAAVMGQDGRASTSKTQVVLWTAAAVWALVDLLLLARAYHGANLFTNAVTSNWRPEYLVLLGVPIAAATTAKAAVASATSSGTYVRNSIGKDVYGFLAGVAELFTGDDDAVAWADLQYVVFTLITLAYFASQFLAQPTAGLPPVPAALLTLMGVSATGYVANKIVSTKVTPTAASAGSQ